MVRGCICAFYLRVTAGDASRAVRSRGHCGTYVSPRLAASDGLRYVGEMADQICGTGP